MNSPVNAQVEHVLLIVTIQLIVNKLRFSLFIATALAVNLGYDIGVIPGSVFFMVVLMAVVTTFMTSPLKGRF